jgi:hypothetical protein
MLCNPNETVGGGTPFNPTVGQLFKFTPKSAGQTTYAPGDFGLVDPPGQDSSGANTIRNLLSQQSPNFCYVNNVSPRPGQVANKVTDGVNVRFDMAPNGAGNQAGLDMTPAPNVIKGDTNPNCNQYTPDASWRFPRDTVMTQTAGVEIGNGVMDTAAKNAYWDAHHRPNGSSTPVTWPVDLPTRYAAYMREVGQNGTVPPWPGTSGEANAPSCNGVTAGDYKRRTITVAVIDCLSQGVQGNQNASLLSNKYAEFFLTEPATDPPEGAIYGEFIQMVTPQSQGATGKLHQVLRLYR